MRNGKNIKKALFSIIFLFIICVFFYYTGKNKYHQKMNVSYGVSHTPLIHVKIDNTYYPLELDLAGSSSELTLSKEILNNIVKKLLNAKTQWRDLLGNQYKSSEYLISAIYFKDLKLKNIYAKEENQEYLDNITLWEEEGDDLFEEYGTIGLKLAEKHNILLDFPRDRLFFSNNLGRLKKEGFDIDSYLPVPFMRLKEGIVFAIDTDVGKNNFLLDTGATISIFRETFFENEEKLNEIHGKKVFFSSKFKIADCDFGKQDLILLNISSEFESFDGILGMDFIKKYVIYLDFDKKIMYLQKP